MARGGRRFLSLFGAKVVFRGIADFKTLDQLSLLCGEYDRRVKTESHHRPAEAYSPRPGTPPKR